MKALEKIVEALGSTELTILSKEESPLFSLIEVYAEKNNFRVLGDLAKAIKASRVDVDGRRRRDLKDIALAMRINVFSEARMARQTPIVDSSILEKLLGMGEGGEK